MSDINIIIKIATKQAEDALNNLGTAADNSGKKLTLFEKLIKNSQGAVNSFIGNLGASAVSKAFSVINNGISTAVTNFLSFEQALVGVGKTTGLGGEELAALGKEIDGLSQRIPIASTELLRIAQISAQLGVRGTENITKFTETVARLASSTDLTAEQASFSLARLINLTGDSVDNVDKISSAIVSLGNNFETTEPQIIALADEIGKAGSRFKVSSTDVLGLAAAMATFGIESQVGGSTFQKVLTEIEKAIGKGGIELARFTTLTQLNNEEFVKLFETDPTELFIRLNEGLSKAQKGGANLSTTLEDLGLSDQRVTKTLGPLITNTEKLRTVVDASSTAYKENKALIEESDTAFNTTGSDIQVLENTWISLTNVLVSVVAPAIRLVVNATKDIIQFTREYNTVMQAGIVFLGLVAAQLLIVNANVLITAASFVTLKIAAAAAWLATLGPLSLIVIGIAALGTAIFVIVKKWDQVKLATLEAYKTLRQFLNLSTEEIDQDIATTKLKIENSKKLQENKKKENDLKRESGQLSGQETTAEDESLKKKLDNLNKEDTAKTNNHQKEKIRKTETVKDEKQFQDEITKIREENRILEEQQNLLMDNAAKARATKGFTELQKQLGFEEAIRIQARLNTVKGEQDKAILLAQIRQSILENAVAKEIEQQQKLTDLKNEQKLREDELEAAKLEAELAKDGQIIEREQLQLDTLADIRQTAREEELLKQQGEVLNAQELANLKLKIEADRIKRSTKLKQDEARIEDNERKKKIQDTAETFQAITTLASFGNEKLFKTAKAFQAANVAIDGIAAIQKAASAAPFPLNVPGILVETARAAVNFAAVKAQQPRFEQGGIVPGSSFSGDKVPVRVNSGEMILNRQQQSNLFNLANNNVIGSSRQMIEVTSVVQIGEEEIARAVSRQVAKGFALGEGGV